MIIRKVRDRWRASQLGQWVEFQTSGTMFIWPQRFMRAMLAAFPKWLLWLWMVLRFVPTPLEIDEWLPAIIALALLLWPAISLNGWRPVFNWHRLARYRSAWRGGKTERYVSGRKFRFHCFYCPRFHFLLQWEAWDISITTRVHARRIVTRTCPRHWFSPLFR